jgi:thiamine-monophosphate kinase
MPSEFELIARHFTRPSPAALLGVGDDAALLRPRPGFDLAISTDMLVAGRHFFPDDDPRELGHKTLAVNLSDLAAMGATPRWALLALALPEADDAWLARFSDGFFGLAARHGVDLIGGDTTRGPLNLCVTILGEVPAGGALRRDGARPGDDIWISGELGGAALGLHHLRDGLCLADPGRTACLARLHAPEPRVALGQALIGLANAAIDISDGLLADLGHILECSGCGAEMAFDLLPRASGLAGSCDPALARRCLLAGGDDYELCFTAPSALREAVEQAAGQAHVGVTRVGVIKSEPGLRVFGAAGEVLDIEERGYDHFS